MVVVSEEERVSLLCFFQRCLIKFERFYRLVNPYPFNKRATHDKEIDNYFECGGSRPYYRLLCSSPGCLVILTSGSVDETRIAGPSYMRK